MATLLPAPGSRGRGPRPISVDMTPLVDLAFLLLSFFILTTSIRKAQALELLFPTGRGEAADVMTVLVTGPDAYYCYGGRFEPVRTDLRRVGLDQLRVLMQAVDTAHAPTWVIKPDEHVTYGTIIDVMDEVIGAGILRYAVRDSIDPAERTAIAALR